MCGWRKEVKEQGCEFFDDGMVWIPCSERLPEECDEYMFTWVTSYAPDKRFIGFAEYDGAGEWDDTNGRWLFEDYIKSYPDVKVLAWMPLPEPYREDGE
jgi:hypothetical protein